MSLPFVHYLKMEIKKEIKIQILKRNFNEDGLHQFSVSNLKKAKWKEDKEFVLNGFYYDIVFMKIIKGEKIYYCFQDKKETKIAKIESKIRDFFEISKFNKPEAKPYFAKTFKANPVSKKISQSFSLLEKKQFLKTNFKSYKNSTKVSDFIDKPAIPPEV